MEKSKSGIKIALIFLYEVIKLIFLLAFTSVFFAFAGLFLSALYLRNFFVKLWKNIRRFNG
jgi:hypothetical protein